MLVDNPLHLLDLIPIQDENIQIELSVKNFLLFSSYEDKICVFTDLAHINEASNYYSKLSENYSFYILDEISFEKLYNKYMELRTDKQIEDMQDEKDEGADEEELSLTDFLRTSSDILTSQESAPIIKFVNALFYQAVKKRASDIHIEVHEKRGEVRFRVDGMLTKNADLDRKVVNLIISRIKVISNLDISETRIPQDGRTQIVIAGKTLDIRVSVLPTFYGERVVMRILMQGDQIPKINDLGFDDSVLEPMQKILRQSHGIILVTGPTGSGKTTSLHAFLQEVESPDKNILTVEDPVEYKSENISQIQVNEKVGLTFAAALRSILRQDPDIVMIGEIRDEETANIAIRAALTGHLVFSTLHTNSAAATISRLADMDIEPFLISSAVLGILAQRLVRVLCEECKEEDTIAENFADDYNIEHGSKIYTHIGCKACNFTGFTGRKSIGELMIMEDEIKEILKETTDEHTIQVALEELGLKSIASQLRLMLLHGETSLDEAIRIGLGH